MWPQGRMYLTQNKNAERDLEQSQQSNSFESKAGRSDQKGQGGSKATCEVKTMIRLQFNMRGCHPKKYEKNKIIANSSFFWGSSSLVGRAT